MFALETSKIKCGNTSEDFGHQEKIYDSFAK